MLYEVTPTAELQELLNCFYEAGGVIEHVLIRSETAKNDYSHHMAAAIFTMQCIQKREKYLELNYDTSKLTGERITPKQFIGPIFDWENRVLFPSIDGTYDSYSTERNCSQGYAMSFTNPPHGLHFRGRSSGRRRNLRGQDSKVNKLFTNLTTILFGDFDKFVEVYSWTTDWCNYFDAGHEWWGSHLWTVNVGDGTMIGIAASTSD